MYKILIVDDEELVRRSILKIVDWKALGFSEVFEAENGTEALQIALEQKPHLVLTDIRMPFMDGLQLTSELKEKLPSSHVVILSGHDEFRYAQEAIGLQVLDYILKPLGAATLTKKLQEIRKKLDNELQEKEYLSKIRLQLHQSLPLLKESILNTLVCTPGNKPGMESRLQSLEIPLYGGPYAVSVIEPDLSGIPPSDAEVYSYAAKNIALETLGHHHPVFTDNLGRVTLVFRLSALPTEDRAHQQLLEILHVLLKSVNIHLKIPTTIGVGTTVSHLSDLHSSYMEALNALDCKYTLGKDRIYDIRDLDYMEAEFYYPFDACNELITAVKTNKLSGIKQALTDICGILKSGKNLTVTNIKLVFVEMITALLKLLSETRQMSAEAWTMGLGLYSQIEKLDTVDKMAEALLQLSIQTSRELAELRTSSSQQIVMKAMDYVRDNYQQEDLSLQTTASHTSVSAGYLSALFKKETGVNFSDYLTRIRMEKAMELLRTTDLKTYEVAYRTGFSNPHYFSISFKKYTRMSPSEFRGEPEE